MKALDDITRDRLITLLIDDPESLSQEEIETILHDDELRGLYDAAVLCKEASMPESVREPDVEAELMRFKASRKGISPIRRWNSQIMRIAAIFAGAIIATIGITAALNPDILHIFNPAASDRDNTETVIDAENLTAGVNSGVSTPITNNEELIYDNITLDSITGNLAGIYDVNVVFNNEDAKGIRLYLKIEQGKTIDDIADILNTFEYFKATVSEKTLTIE